MFMMNEVYSTATQVSESKPLGQQDFNTSVSSFPNTRRLTPNLAREDLLTGDYNSIGYPLYHAAKRSDWNAAKAILDANPDLVRYCIARSGETPLHIAVTVKRSKLAEKFIENLVEMMEKEDFELQNRTFKTALNVAAAGGNIEAVKIIVKKNRDTTNIPGGLNQDLMPLYMAAMHGHYEVVKYLYELSNGSLDADGWDDENRGWLLAKCVEGDMFDVALKIAKRYPHLGSGSVLESLARRPDAFKTKTNIITRTINSGFALCGITSGVFERDNEALQMLKIIWEDIVSNRWNEIDTILRGSYYSIEEEAKRSSEKGILAMQLQLLVSEHLHNLDVETQRIMGGPPNEIQLHSGNNLDQALQLQKLIFKHLRSLRVETQNLINQENVIVFGMKDQALQLQNAISNHIMKMHADTNKIITQENPALNLYTLIYEQIGVMRDASTFTEYDSYQVLFTAAEMGNTPFLAEILSRRPNLMWRLNYDNQSIFHVAVKYRHVGVYNLLYETGSWKDLIIPYRDANDNNMLHLVGKMTIEERLADVSGPALQMQRELLWFKEVMNMTPPYYREEKNRDGLTPRELFSKEHKDLIKEGEKWMKDTASQCMVVAALIATIVFAVAFTVPGGYDQNTGIPMFYQKPIFVVFIVADAMSLFLSSASILTFLSILTSRYAERDFMRSLPKKLMLGLLTLFLSVATMMITFSVSFFTLYHNEVKWIPIFISVGATMPVFLYVMLQYHVLADVVRSTYGTEYLFKPSKQFLYYENPRV
ncbi:hypothetical protein QVD17_37034 [Tagetes erecta]|uniref:PGG domain-containing protein n=1 Tax=Tagetes erecta TaxID=13708 RepID=A0AAD8JTT5_TARER|nr:hypothetical protein QVD17_37034 [Tagetes erecta]